MTKQIKKETPILTSPLKWAGGKRWLVPEITKLFAESGKTRLVEPFCGACSIAFGVKPKKALLNDINPQLVIFLQFILQGHGMLLSLGGNNRENYDRLRRRYNEIQFPISGDTIQELASIFYYLNRTCFNGLYRVNSKGEFNVPFGKYKTITYKQEFPELVEAAKNWKITWNDFEDIKTTKEDFVYADPPYDSPFVQFSSAGFDYADQVRLAAWLAKQKGTIVASNAATPRIKALYKELGFTIRIIDAPRRISSDGNRDKVKEMLAIKM